MDWWIVALCIVVIIGVVVFLNKVAIYLLYIVLGLMVASGEWLREKIKR